MLELDYFLMNRLAPGLNSMLPVICGDSVVNVMIQIDARGCVDFRHEKYGAAPTEKLQLAVRNHFLRGPQPLAKRSIAVPRVI